MRYNFNGKNINIPDNEIEKMMKGLDVDKEEAIQIWLEDNEYLDNEEQTELDEKASKVKIKLGARADTETKEKKPRTVKISDEKQHLFANIKCFLEGYCLNNGGNVRVEKENKLLILEINGKTFKIDLIEQRKPKKQDFFLLFWKKCLTNE